MSVQQTSTAAAQRNGDEELNPFKIALAQFDRAADLLELSDSMRHILKNTKRQLVVSIPVKMDGGDVQVFGGYRVQHWTEERVHEALEQTIRRAFHEVYGRAQHYRTDMRTAAYVLAVGRVAEATSVRGIFPSAVSCELLAVSKTKNRNGGES